MFWNKDKKKSKQNDAGFSIDFDLDQRQHYRVEPKKGEPVFFLVAGKRLSVVDVSAGGVAVRATGLKPGQKIKGILQLPHSTPVPLIVEVVKILGGNMIAFEIIKNRPEDEEVIHQYVLTRQKEELERQRQCKLAEPG